MRFVVDNLRIMWVIFDGTYLVSLGIESLKFMFCSK